MDEHGEKSSNANSGERDYSIAFLCITVALCTVAGAYVGLRLAGWLIGIFGIAGGFIGGLYFAASELSKDEEMPETGRPLKYISFLTVIVLGYIFAVELSVKLLGSDQPLGLYNAIPPIVLVVILWIFELFRYLLTAIWQRIFGR